MNSHFLPNKVYSCNHLYLFNDNNPLLLKHCNYYTTLFTLKKILFFLLLLSCTTIRAQISGCTDPLSKNFNPAATINDGSCTYSSIRLKPTYSVKLHGELSETSSLMKIDSLLWTSNDNTDTTIYAMDTRGIVQNKIRLTNVTNSDWEEMAQDSAYYYIGDIGNNGSGNRKDLHILRIGKKSFFADKQKFDTISFSYSNQTDFSATKPNKTNYDCEAFIVSGDSIYLFTKQWKDKRTTVYSIPKKPGNHIAVPHDSFNARGLITASTYLREKRLLVLAGYSKTLSPFLYLFYDFNGSKFFSRNKRKIKVALRLHQIESITTIDGLQYYLTNENLVRKPIINVQQQLHKLDLTPLLTNYLNR